MAQTLFLATIAFIFAVLGFNELRFLSNARQVPATIIELFTAVRTGDGVPIGERDKEIAKKASIKLEGPTDKREGEIVLPDSIWENLSIENSVKVWAFAEKPKWVFWSPMIRYKKRDIWVKINFALMSVFIVLASMSYIGSIK